MSGHHHFGPERFACDVLEEMRKCFKTYNFSPVPGLIEELQSIVNRMESGLSISSNINEIVKIYSDKKRELRGIEQQVEQRKKELGRLKTAIAEVA